MCGWEQQKIPSKVQVLMGLLGCGAHCATQLGIAEGLRGEGLYLGQIFICRVVTGA